MSTSVTVTWTTDKSSDSYVEYGLSSSYGTVSGKDESSLSHSVTVTGLSPSTTYHFRVKSKDSDGNTGTSNDSTFTTKDKSVITEVTISDISLNSAILSWTTNVISKSNVKIGTKINSYDKEIQEESTDKTLNHVARIKDLAEGTKYYLRIEGTDGDGNNITSDDYPFSTVFLPRISNIEIKGSDDHSLTITWQTNVPSDSVVSFGKELEKLETDKGKSDLATNHEVKLAGLDDNTKYYYKVKSRDKYGNISQSAVKEASTSMDNIAPVISEVKSESVIVGDGNSSRIQMIVSWQTDEPATSMVEYGEGITSNYTNKTNEDSKLAQPHLIIISGLKASTTYHFKVSSSDQVGNRSVSSEYTILTPQRETSTLELILKSWEETFAWVQNLKKIVPLWPL
ncbi:MAG: fibronectin type III domain-containing protein [Patescibacteria group bacterium]|nr:fibronectin type III domain-containing protein [Patescibacteria group bacterium]